MSLSREWEAHVCDGAGLSVRGERLRLAYDLLEYTQTEVAYTWSSPRISCQLQEWQLNVNDTILIIC